MAGDNGWWFNRAGAFAPVSNPGSAVPNYGLTMDITTAPMDKEPDYKGLADSLGAAVRHTSTRQMPKAEPAPEPTIWDRVTGAAGWAGSQVAGVAGAADAGLNKLGLDALLSDEEQAENDAIYAEADKRGLKGWERYQFIAKAGVGEAFEEESDSVLFKGLEKVNEYSSAAFLYASLNEDDTSDFFTGKHWAKARRFAREQNWNAGEAFTQMFMDKEVLLDEERMEKIRQHNTIFNVSALAFNVVGAWKADPNVFIGKTVGGIRNKRAGVLAQEGAVAGIQRDILAAPDRASAEAMARNAGSLTNRVRAHGALSLYDKAQNLRVAAQTMGFEDFKNLAPFKNSASGVVMAKLMKDTADSDADWNLVFRSAIGDASAVDELSMKQGEVADKIAAIEMRSLPHLEDQLGKVQARYEKRLAEQGRVGAELEITRYGDWLLDNDLNTLKADVDAKRAELASYESHESWLRRALPGLNLETDAVDSRVANSIFGNLEQVNPGRSLIGRSGEGARGSLYALGGKVSTWRNDDYSPVSRLFRAPAKPFLKRTGVVALNDVDEGGQAVNAYLDQIAYVTGRNDQGARDSILGKWAGSLSDVERKDIVDELERQAVGLLGRKYGLSGAVMDRVARDLQDRRGSAWSKLSDRSMYTAVKGENGKRLDLLEFKDDHGNVQKVRMPMDPSELPNWRPLTNLTDLDHSLRMNKDLFAEMSKAEQAGLWTARHTENLYNMVGETMNSFWKPLALISLRWPTRVVADESFRIMLMMGALPHMKAWGQGLANTAYNQGIARPREWWNGRQVKTASLAEDSLRALSHQFDPYDHRAQANPTGAVPASGLDFDRIDKKRYSKLNEETSKRWQYLRSMEATRRNAQSAREQSGERMADAVYALTKPERPKWAQQWDDRLAAAEQSTERGFFFDPVTRKATNKGFAVSPYPGKLKTFERRPTAREMNYFTEKNSDLLAIQNNRVAVWLDKDTGRWHLDVVKTSKRKEDAMLLASQTEATEFYDIEDGFTRFMSEDFYGHFDSPFVKPEPEPRQGFDKITTETIQGTPREVTMPHRKGVGFGRRKWRSADGRMVEGEAVYGADKVDPNIYWSATSSQGAFQGLLGGHTRGLGQNRARRTTRGYRVFEPGDDINGPEAKAWAESWTYYVNNHMRVSPIWLRMLNGESDERIIKWLGTPEGNRLRKRMGPRGFDPNKWVTEMRAIFDHTLPTAEARLAAKTGDVDPKRVDELIPLESRNEVHGQDIELTAGTHDAQQMWFKFVDKAYTMLGSMPTDALVRHPFASNVYDLRMRNYLSSVPADQITNKVLAAAEASARAFAVKQTRRLLYNIADEMEGVHMLRFLSPFFQAQLEVLERYSHIWTKKPESLARTLMLFNQSQTVNTSLFQVVNSEGEPAEEYSHDNQVVLQVTPFMRKIADRIPGLKGALDNAGSMTIPVASMNLILQGENPILPSAGPLVTIPASEFYFRDKPWKSESEVYRWLFPFGTPDGSNAVERGVKGVLPAWARRTWTAVTADFDDSAFANRANIIYQDMLLAHQQGKRDEPPTEQEALDATKNEYMLRAMSSFFMPVPLTPKSPHQFWIDQSRAYRDKFGLEAGERFYDDFGADAFAYFVESSKSTNGLAPTSKQSRGYVKHKRLIDNAPDLAGVIAGPFGYGGEFNDAVYQWQLETRRSPLSKQNMREIKDPAERIKDVQVDRGWIEYGKLSSALDAELRRRGLASVENSGAEDLKFWRDQEIEGIISRNPAFSDAYQSREQKLGTWLQQAYRVAFDESLDGRTDIEGLRAYLVSRAKVQEALQDRQSAGLVQSDSLAADENADLAEAWGSYTRELVSKNLLFAEIYHRYLDNDDLTTYISPGG